MVPDGFEIGVANTRLKMLQLTVLDSFNFTFLMHHSAPLSNITHMDLINSMQDIRADMALYVLYSILPSGQ